MKSRESELMILYLLTDLIILNLSVFSIISVTSVVSFSDYHNFSAYVLHANLSWVLTYFILSKKNLYLRDGYFNRIKRITNRVLTFIGVALILAYLFMPRMTYSRVFLLEYTALFYIGKLVVYYILYHYLNFLRKKGIHVNRVVIVGLNDTGRSLNKLIKYNPGLGYDFLGYVSDHDDKNAPILGKPDELESLLKHHQVELVFVTLSLFNDAKKSKDILRLCNRLGVRLRFVPENQQWFRKRINMESVGQLVMINPQ